MLFDPQAGARIPWQIGPWDLPPFVAVLERLHRRLVDWLHWHSMNFYSQENR